MTRLLTASTSEADRFPGDDERVSDLRIEELVTITCMYYLLFLLFLNNIYAIVYGLIFIHCCLMLFSQYSITLTALPSSYTITPLLTC